MKNGIFILLISVVLPISSWGQIGNIIGHTASVSKEMNNSFLAEKKNGGTIASEISMLAKSITKNSTSEEQQAKALFVWIANNISYDNELHNSKSLQKTFYTSEENVVRHVLNRKRALCGGYAFLYEKLCSAIGLEVAVIHGYSNEFATKVNRSKPNHTWNAVKLNGKWQLLDITWAISHSRDGGPNLFWFKTSPKDFLKTHRPEDRDWTLTR